MREFIVPPATWTPIGHGVSIYIGHSIIYIEWRGAAPEGEER